MATKTPKAKHIKLLESLVKGKSFTLSQIGDKFGAANPSDLLFKIRKLDVTVSTRKNTVGTTVYFISNE